MPQNRVTAEVDAHTSGHQCMDGRIAPSNYRGCMDGAGQEAGENRAGSRTLSHPQTHPLNLEMAVVCGGCWAAAVKGHEGRLGWVASPDAARTGHRSAVVHVMSSDMGGMGLHRGKQSLHCMG